MFTVSSSDEVATNIAPNVLPNAPPDFLLRRILLIKPATRSRNAFQAEGAMPVTPCFVISKPR